MTIKKNKKMHMKSRGFVSKGRGYPNASGSLHGQKGIPTIILVPYIPVDREV